MGRTPNQLQIGIAMVLGILGAFFFLIVIRPAINSATFVGGQDPNSPLLRATGIKTSATILSGISVNGQAVITFYFRDKDGYQTSSCQVPYAYFKSLVKGQQITVYYLPNTPSIACVMDAQAVTTTTNTVTGFDTSLGVPIVGGLLLFIGGAIFSAIRLRDAPRKRVTPPSPPQLTVALMDKLEPYTPQIISRLNGQESREQVANDIAAQSGVTVAEVNLYISELVRVAQKKQNKG